MMPQNVKVNLELETYLFSVYSTHVNSAWTSLRGQAQSVPARAAESKEAITSKTKRAIKHKTSPARLAQLLHNCCSPH